MRIMAGSFVDLGISPPILKAIEEMGYTAPTEIQSKAIPYILNKQDLIVRAKTGSGKTAVFGVSLLQLTDADAPGPQGLILTPTRELAVQVDNDLRQLGRHLMHKTAVVYGKHSMHAEIQAIRKGVTILTGTPGRVYDHIQQGNLETGNIRFLVLDEADRMLDMGFIDQVESIIKTLPKDRVTLLFSATIPPEIERICVRYMNNPITVEIESPTKTVDTIPQCYYRVQPNEKLTRLNQLLLLMRPESCMIFCNTKKAVDQVTHFLNRKGYAAQALHGDIPQGRRLATMQQFKKGGFHLLVATDVAARGIHVDDLSLVINYDVPNEKDNYVHRIGRTGRAGHDGQAVSLVTTDDTMTLYEIEEHIGTLIEEAEWPDESELQKHAAEVEQWIKDHSLGEKPAGVSSRSGKSRTQRGLDKAPRMHPSKAKTARSKRTLHKSSEKRSSAANSIPSANQQAHAGDGHVSSGRSSGRIRIVHASDKAKPVYVAARPSVIRSSEESRTTNGAKYNNTGKKSLFRALFSRLFSKWNNKGLKH